MGISAVIMILAQGAPAGYFSDSSAVRESRVLLGFGLRQEGAGLTYQRELPAGLGLETGAGVGIADGLRSLLGAGKTWKREARLRPRVHAGLQVASGASLTNIHMTGGGGDTSTFSYRTKPSLSTYLAAGLQWRLFWRLGIEAEIGYARTLIGGGYSLESTGDEAPIRDLIEATSGSGLTFGNRLFLEF